MEIEQLIVESLRIEDGFEVIWLVTGREEAISPSYLMKVTDAVYCVSNDVICYILGGEAYVTPWTREKVRTLCRAGMAYDKFYVPLSNGYIPRDKELQARWIELCQEAVEARYREYEREAICFANEYGIGKLSEETLARCFRVPRNGMAVRAFWGVDEYMVYPICNERWFDSIANQALGRYSSSDGKTVFVYRDGGTYVARGYWIIYELEDAGYRPTEFFIPFNGSDVIVDPELAKLWQQAR